MEHNCKKGHLWTRRAIDRRPGKPACLLILVYPTQPLTIWLLKLFDWTKSTCYLNIQLQYNILIRLKKGWKVLNLATVLMQSWQELGIGTSFLFKVSLKTTHGRQTSFFKNFLKSNFEVKLSWSGDPAIWLWWCWDQVSTQPYPKIPLKTGNSVIQFNQKECWTFHLIVVRSTL